MMNSTVRYSDFEEWYSGYISKKPNLIPLIEQNLDKVDWEVLSENPNAVSILEQKLHKINWSNFNIAA